MVRGPGRGDHPGFGTDPGLLERMDSIVEWTLRLVPCLEKSPCYDCGGPFCFPPNQTLGVPKDVPRVGVEDGTPEAPPVSW